jgi:hypothetical protein
MKTRTSLLLALAALLPLFTTGCADEESALGLGLNDPNTIYNGISETFYANDAYSMTDDSLLTSGYSFGIIGIYNDPTFGKVTSELYTQIALADNTNSINFDEVIIDSVVLSLVKERLYPDSTATYNFHFEVKQLSQAIETDSSYYASDSIPVDEGTTFFDSTVSVGYADTVVSLKLGGTIGNVLSQRASAEDFIQLTKGLRIRMLPDSDNGMLGINFSATQTCITVYYTYANNPESDSNTYVFPLNGSTVHFNHFTHDYTGTVFAGTDSIEGSQALYLEPLAGHKVHVSFDEAVRAFHEAHPMAVIHYAELLLPNADPAADDMPDRVIALTRNASGDEVYINDLIDLYTATGYDGKYNADTRRYRLRVTQHLQGMLRNGADNGTILVLNSRRSSALHAVIGGYQASTASDRIRIEFVYTE